MPWTLQMLRLHICRRYSCPSAASSHGASTRGDIDASLNTLKMSDEPTDVVSKKTYELLFMGYPAHNLASVAELLKEIRCTATELEQGHGVSCSCAPVPPHAVH